MAHISLLIAALALNDPVTPPSPADQAADTALFDAAVSCAAYHVYMASMASPGSDAAKLGEARATTFLLASYAKMPSGKEAEAEAKIEATVAGLFEDSVSIDADKHKRELEELEQVCLDFEPTASKIIEAAGFSKEP